MTAKVTECDLLVVGAGGTGLICAVKAAELTGKKVILIEKAKKPGGASILGHGPRISDSTWQKNAGAKVNNPPDASGQMFDWLVSMGGAEKYFKVQSATFMGVGSQQYSIVMPHRIDKYKDLDDASIGPGFIVSYMLDKLLDHARNLNFTLLTQTGARRFVKNSEGKIRSVFADTKDGELQINFEACYIAAGGFGANYEKCQKLWPTIYNNIPMHNLNPWTLTGDVIDAAEEAGMGIDLKNAGCNVQGPIHHPYSYTIVAMSRYPGMGLQIDMEGNRYVRTGGGQPGPMDDSIPPRIYSIADQEIIEKAGASAAESINEDDDKLIARKWRDFIEEEVAVDEKGRYGRHTTRANTLVELAMKLEIDPQVLLATVEKYNKDCETAKSQPGGQADPNGGTIPGAGNQAGMMGAAQMPVEKGPFYAIFSQRFRQCTHGGIIVNEDQEVLDPKGNVMPGLYAGGDCTTEYLVETGASNAAQRRLAGAIGALKQGRRDGAAAPYSGPGLFGKYYAMKGGGGDGIARGYSTAFNIAKYLGSA
jgi:succinate dehydrogenase/fumarate reductase flavoprotein subunit